MADFKEDTTNLVSGWMQGVRELITGWSLEKRVVVGVVLFVLLWLFFKYERVLSFATFIVLTATLAILIRYAYDTSKIAHAARFEATYMTPARRATYSMVMADTPRDRVLFRLHNPSTLLLKSKVYCEIKVCGESVNSPADYSGTNFWYVLPQRHIQQWFELGPILQQQGKTWDLMMTERTHENRRSQLILDVEVEFVDEIDNTYRTPVQRSFFDFEERAWIQIFTKAESSSESIP